MEYVMNEPYKTLTKQIKVNDHPIEVKVTITIDDDDMNVDGTFDFGNEAENAKHLKRFTDGELFLASICIKATALDLEGTDSLCGVECPPNNMFNPSPFESCIDETIEIHGMIDIAIEELKTNLQSEYKRLTENAERYRKFSL